MSLVAFSEVVHMGSYRASVPQLSDPLVYLHKLERDLAMSEQKTASLLEDLAKRLDLLENRVTSMTERFDVATRQIERDVIALADRLHTLEGE